jgi:hypothetical protein
MMADRPARRKSAADGDARVLASRAASTRTCRRFWSVPLRRTVTTSVVRRWARTVSRAELATHFGAGSGGCPRISAMISGGVSAAPQIRTRCRP